MPLRHTLDKGVEEASPMLLHSFMSFLAYKLSIPMLVVDSNERTTLDGDRCGGETDKFSRTRKHGVTILVIHYDIRTILFC